jgi:glycosyltransferase involved in cell wall biosynthesis
VSKFVKVILEAQHAVGHEEPRGIGHYSINLIQALLRRKAFEYELTYFDYNREIGNYQRAEKYFGGFNIPMYECNELDYRIASRDNNVWSAKSYNEWTKTSGDIYHFMNPVSIPTKLNGKMIVTVHDVNWELNPDMVSELLKPLFKLSMKRIEKTCPHIIAGSQSARSQLLQYSNVSAEQISVIYQSYDEENIFYDNSCVCDIVDGDYLFYVGALAPNKNIDRIMNAFNIIAYKHKDLKLIIAGKSTWDDTTAIYNAINSSQFRERIIMPGYVSVEKKRQLYSNALCFVFPSLHEGFGIPVLEAMACGCPVITADNTSLPEVGGDAAIYVNAYNTEQLAHEMERVVDSENLREELRQKGFKQSKKFSWEKTAQRVENIYNKLR